MEILKKILLFFEGKKTYFNSLALVIVPFLVSSGCIDMGLGAMITSIIGILTGTLKVTSDYSISKNNGLGKAIMTKRNKR